MMIAAGCIDALLELGTGPDARIEVRLRDKSKLKGYVSKVGEDSFVIADPKTGTETAVPYPAVTKATGKNLSTGAIIAISILAGVGIVLLILWAIVVSNN